MTHIAAMYPLQKGMKNQLYSTPRATAITPITELSVSATRMEYIHAQTLNRLKNQYRNSG